MTTSAITGHRNRFIDVPSFIWCIVKTLIHVQNINILNSRLAHFAGQLT